MSSKPRSCIKRPAHFFLSESMWCKSGVDYYYYWGQACRSFLRYPFLEYRNILFQLIIDSVPLAQSKWYKYCSPWQVLVSWEVRRPLDHFNIWTWASKGKINESIKITPFWIKSSGCVFQAEVTKLLKQMQSAGCLSRVKGCADGKGYLLLSLVSSC